jgi:6-phosphofructokinase 2
MTPILTVTLNPALDVSTSTSGIRPGPKLRCTVPSYDPGGGGINISRAIKLLGGETRALVALGGATGSQIAGLLAASGIEVFALPAPGETRQSVVVTDADTGGQFRFMLPGPDWSQAQVLAAANAIAVAAPAGGLVAVSGSQPPGFPDDFLGQVCARLRGTASVVADTSGAPLIKAAATPGLGLAMLRMDAEEAEALAGHPLDTRADSADFAQGLLASGVAQMVVVARGADGSVLVTDRGRWFCTAAKVPVVSKVGAGDSFMAGFVLALAQGEAPKQALAYGVAAASAAVMTPATALCRAEDATRLLAQCPVGPL